MGSCISGGGGGGAMLYTTFGTLERGGGCEGDKKYICFTFDLLTLITCINIH